MGIIFSLLGLGNPRKRLVRSLRGKTFIIPDLESIFHHWPYAVNPEVDRLKKELNQRMEQYFSGNMLRKMQQADAAVFGASWWPYASYDTLYVAACLGLWLFAWDDETDSVEISTMLNDSERGAAFRQETKDFIRQFLVPDSDHSISKNPIITNFEVVGVAIRDACTNSQRETFFRELEYFIDMVDEEQKVLLSGRLPTVEEYQRRRMGSGAVGVCLAITE
ncbi:hypothetical protein Plec18167_004766 [Paecilomyces lecythidis]|uniref:Terpenoid synthase n=1 Tax=Paecilomyces lecythidis TaxID=3004212 RepID=A0ABR3XQJ0_9EURO